MKTYLKSNEARTFKPYQFVVEVETVDDHRVLNRFLKRGCEVKASDPFCDTVFCSDIKRIRESDPFIKNGIE